MALLAPLPDDLRAALHADGHRVVNAFDGSDDASLAAATVAVTRGALPTGEAVFARLPALRLLCCYGTGYDGVDLAAAARRGVLVCNSAGANASSVADMAMGFVIALLREMPVADRHVRLGRWREAAVRLPASRGLTGARLGIFGYGDVGRRLALRAQACEMVVGCCSRRPSGDENVHDFPDLVALAEWADVLVLAARADATTYHAVDERVLEALGPAGHLVNVARGSLVDEAALVRALQGGRLAGYASDVFEHEPDVPAPLLDFANTVLTPHVGGATRSAQEAMARRVVQNVRHFVETGAPFSPVALPA